MDNKADKCDKCRNFFRYYTKGVSSFKKTQFGYCRDKGEMVKSNEHCEKCVALSNSGKSIRRRALMLSLNGLLTEISAIRNVLEEEESETDKV